MTPDLKSIKAAAENLYEWYRPDPIKPGSSHPWDELSDLDLDRARDEAIMLLSQNALAQIAALDEQGDGEVVAALKEEAARKNRLLDLVQSRLAVYECPNCLMEISCCDCMSVEEESQQG